MSKSFYAIANPADLRFRVARTDRNTPGTSLFTELMKLKFERELSEESEIDVCEFVSKTAKIHYLPVYNLHKPSELKIEKAIEKVRKAVALKT